MNDLIIRQPKLILGRFDKEKVISCGLIKTPIIKV